jgi:hypothetical protein
MVKRRSLEYYVWFPLNRLYRAIMWLIKVKRATQFIALAERPRWKFVASAGSFVTAVIFSSLTYVMLIPVLWILGAPWTSGMLANELAWAFTTASFFMLMRLGYHGGMATMARALGIPVFGPVFIDFMGTVVEIDYPEDVDAFAYARIAFAGPIGMALVAGLLLVAYVATGSELVARFAGAALIISSAPHAVWIRRCAGLLSTRRRRVTQPQCYVQTSRRALRCITAAHAVLFVAQVSVGLAVLWLALT